MTLGIDIGGTYLRYELRKKKKSIKQDFRKNASLSLRSFLEDFLAKEKDITQICISFAGQVKEGVILASPNIEGDTFAIKSYFEQKYDVELFIENDLNCAVLAEAKYFQSSNIAVLSLGSGLGLGVVSEARLLRGFESMAAELGHIPYRSSPFYCGCGKSNCLELFASGIALGHWKEYYKLDKDSSLEELQATKVYTLFIEALHHAVGTTITLFNPEVLVLGGGIMTNNRYLKDIIVSKLKEYALPIAVKNIKIQNTQLTNASLEGAFLLKDSHV